MLNLSHNVLAEFPKGHLSHPLAVLDLSHNIVNTFDLDSLDMVQFLNLSWNRLTSLSNWQNVPATVKQLRLEGNPWQCDCEDGPHLQQLIVKHADIILDVHTIECYHSETADVTNASVRYVTTAIYLDCYQNHNQSIAVGNGTVVLTSAQFDIVPIVLPMSLIFVFLLLLVIGLHFRDWIDFQCYIHTGCRCRFPKSQRRHFNYDVFINYSRDEEDIRIMRRDILPLLEDHYYTTYIPDRDWPGGHDHFDVIDYSIKNNQTIILLVSDAFCNNDFCMFTFLETVAAEKLERSKRLIIVQTSAITVNTDDELKQYLKSRRSVILQDPKFRRKLLYLLPKPSVGQNVATEREMSV